MKKLCFLFILVLISTGNTVSAQHFDFNKEDFLSRIEKVKKPTEKKINTIVFDDIGYYLVSNWKETNEFFLNNETTDSLKLHLSFTLPKKGNRATAIKAEATGLPNSLSKEINTLVKVLDFSPFRSRTLFQDEITFKDSILLLKPKVDNTGFQFVFKPNGRMIPKCDAFTKPGIYLKGKKIKSFEDLTKFMIKTSSKISQKSLAPEKIDKITAKGMFKFLVKFKLHADGILHVTKVTGNNTTFQNILKEDFEGQKVLKQGVTYFGHEVKMSYTLPVKFRKQ